MRPSPHSLGAALAVAIPALLGALRVSAQLTVITDAATGVGTTTATLNGTVNRNGHPYTYTAAFEWGLTASYGHRTPLVYVDPNWPPNLPLPISAVLTDVQAETTYRYRAIATNTTPPYPPAPAFGQDRTFTTLRPPRPEVTTLDASEVRPKCALLNSIVNPMGYSTLGWFEWDMDSNYRKTTAVQYLGNAKGAVSMCQLLPRLFPGTTYFFRPVASNSFGVTRGEGRALTTLALPCPTIRTSVASDGSFMIEAANSTGDVVDIQMTTSLQPPIHWEYVTSLNPPAVLPLPIHDAPQRFYRAVMVGNHAPVLAAIGDKRVDEGSTLTFTASATHADPEQSLTYRLGTGAPAQASINPATGAFSWTPSEAEGPGTYVLTVLVTDDVTPPLEDAETITVIVNEVNQAPVLAPIGTHGINAGYELTFTATATDPDPGQTLRFSLGPGAPAGATINAGTGVFSWTPDTGGSFSITIIVTDNGTPPQSDSETITVNVWEDRPTLTGPATVDTGTFTIQWTYDWPQIGSSQEGYELQESTTSATAGFVTILNTVNHGDRESPKSYTLTGKTAGTYWYQVRAYERSYSSWSHVLQVKVTPPSSLEAFASADNVLIYSTMDSSKATTVYRTGELGVGIDWVYGDPFNSWVVSSTALKFDVQSSIAGRQIARATLTLWPTVLPADWDTKYQAAAFAGSWNSTSITFQNQPNYFLSGIATANLPTTTVLPVEWDVTAIVRNWANNTWANNGFLLRDQNDVFPGYTAFRATDFYSSDWYDDSNHRPKLVIEFQ